MKRSSKILLLVFAPLALIACVLMSTSNRVVSAQEKKPPIVDWQKLLGEVRERFAKSQVPALEQTRIDRAYFSFNAKDPDQPPYLHVTGVALKTASDDEKAMLDVL